MKQDHNLSNKSTTKCTRGYRAWYESLCSQESWKVLFGVVVRLPRRSHGQHLQLSDVRGGAIACVEDELIRWLRHPVQEELRVPLLRFCEEENLRQQVSTGRNLYLSVSGWCEKVQMHTSGSKKITFVSLLINTKCVTRSTPRSYMQLRTNSQSTSVMSSSWKW